MWGGYNGVGVGKVYYCRLGLEKSGGEGYECDVGDDGVGEWGYGGVGGRMGDERLSDLM